MDLGVASCSWERPGFSTSCSPGAHHPNRPRFLAGKYTGHAADQLISQDELDRGGVGTEAAKKNDQLITNLEGGTGRRVGEDVGTRPVDQSGTVEKANN